MTVEPSHISKEQLVEWIVREVVAELSKRGVAIGEAAAAAPVQHARPESVLEVDMSGYRTPVLTEGQLAGIGAGVSTIVVPCNTVVAPGAWGVIRSRKLKLVRKTQSNR